MKNRFAKVCSSLLLPCCLTLASSSALLPEGCSEEVRDVTSLLQTGTQRKAPAGPPAPAEGGPFSSFYNDNHIEGHGENRWLHYFPAYARHFSQFIGKEVHIMEIGNHNGGSVDMWKSVFGPRAQVYGDAINPDKTGSEDKRTKVFLGDRSTPEFWEKVMKQVPRIDILIDGGEHSVDQHLSLRMMLQHLSPNGIYVAENVYGEGNKFWNLLQLNRSSVPVGIFGQPKFHFEGLGSQVNSVHVYPFMLVIEKTGNAGRGALFRQLGVKSKADVPTDKRIVAAAEKSAEQEDLWPIVKDMPPKSWLIVQDGNHGDPLSYEGTWNDRADSFMSKALNDFKFLHEGDCCNREANLLQQSVESLHFYPHLLIAKHTEGQGFRFFQASTSKGRVTHTTPPPFSFQLPIALPIARYMWAENHTGPPDIGAMIVDSRCHIALPLVVWNMRKSLPKLPIQFFYTDENEACVKGWFSHMESMTLTKLESSFWKGSKSRSEISWLFTNSAFWDKVQHEKVLYFQPDSWVCNSAENNAETKLAHFAQNDYVGAPWDMVQVEGHNKCGSVGNGGFSLRTVKLMHDISERLGQTEFPEDLYFCQHIREAGGVLANKSEAGDFSAEDWDYSHNMSTLGVHQAWMVDWFRNEPAMRKNCPGLFWLQLANILNDKYLDASKKTDAVAAGIALVETVKKATDDEAAPNDDKEDKALRDAQRVAILLGDRMPKKAGRRNWWRKSQSKKEHTWRGYVVP